jgi:hypothetical protein
MSVATTIPILIDSVAAVRETIKAALSTRTSWWDIVDAAGTGGDPVAEAFENRMKGTAMTAADTAIDNAAVWGAAALRQLPQLLNTYLRVEEAMSSPYLASYLATVGWRVPYGYAEAYYEATGGRIAAQYVMPPGFQAVDETTPVGRGLHCFGTWTGTATWADVDGALTNSVGAVVMPVSMTASPGGTNPIVTLTRYDASTWDTAALTFDATQYGHGANGVGSAYLGSAAVGVGGAAAGQKDVLCKTSIAQFAANAWVLLIGDNGTEVIQIASKNSLTLTMKTNLVYAIAENASVIPLWTDVDLKSGTIDASPKQVAFYAQPERLIDMAPVL